MGTCSRSLIVHTDGTIAGARTMKTAKAGVASGCVARGDPHRSIDWWGDSVLLRHRSALTGQWSVGNQALDGAGKRTLKAVRSCG
jgi:hypothetical protein